MKPVSIQPVICSWASLLAWLTQYLHYPVPAGVIFILILVPAKGRGSCDCGLGVHLLEGGFIWGCSGKRGPLGALGFEELLLEMPCHALPKHGWGFFFRISSFVELLNTHVFGNSQKTHVPFLFWIPMNLVSVFSAHYTSCLMPKDECGLYLLLNKVPFLYPVQNGHLWVGLIMLDLRWLRSCSSCFNSVKRVRWTEPSGLLWHRGM